MRTRLAILALSSMCACHKAAQTTTAPPPPPVHVATAVVETKPMPRELPLTGSLVANQQADVAANAAGRVLKTFVERGSVVKADAPLAQLDTRTASLSQAEARANYQVAQAQQSLAQSQCTRNEELFNKGAISKDEWDRIKSGCTSALSSSEAAMARAELANKTIADSTIRAPFAGMVSERYISVGEYVQASSRVVALVELQPLRLQLTVSEADVGHIAEGQQVSFDVAAYPGETFVGTVQYIGPALRSASRDLVVEAKVPNLDSKLRPGMFATAHLHLGDVPMPVVPTSALQQHETTTHAFVVVDNHLEERVVQVGPQRDGMVGILEGVRAGERIATETSRDVRDGVTIN